MTTPAKWWLIADEDVNAVTGWLRAGDDAGRSQALHTLETGLHRTDTRPADFEVPALTDSQRAAQPLLDVYGIILLPEEINRAAYEQMTWALVLGRALHPHRPLELRCHSDGGETHTAFGIVDLIQADGNVDGIALGYVASSASFIWAACQRRYVYPGAVLAVHGVLNGELEAVWGQRTFERKVRTFARANARIAALYAAASTLPEDKWLALLQNTNEVAMSFGADELIALDMAQPIGDREPYAG